MTECIKENKVLSNSTTSVINSLLLSGLKINKFMFLGFVPRKDSEKIKLFENNKKNEATLVFFESPKRISKTLTVMKKIYPSSKKVVICREMTKKHEEVLRGTISSILDKVLSRNVKGEICLLIEGNQNSKHTTLDLSYEIKNLVLKEYGSKRSRKAFEFNY